MSKLRLLGATLIVVLTFVSSGVVQAATNLYYNISVGTTSSWFTVDNWKTDWRGGDSLLPEPADNVYLNGGVCFVDAGSNVVVNKLGNFNNWMGGTYYTLDVEQGATLSVSNYFHAGNEFVDATVNLRGTLNVINAINNGFSLGGYRAGLTNSTGILNIDGGTLTYGTGAGTFPMYLGGASTGIVEVTNGGMFVNHASCNVGGGEDSQSDGTILMQDGSWTNVGGMTVGNNGGAGRVIINGGGIYSMKIGDSCLSIGSGGATGYLEVNGGEFVGRNEFNDSGLNANRALINVGNGTGSIGKFVQNGGMVDAVGLNIGISGGVGNVIISNGVFKAMASTPYSIRCYNINDGAKLTIAGGEFNCYTNGATGQIRSGGTLEFISGKFAARYAGMTLYTDSNATIRIVGPKCDIDVGWWRHNSADPKNAVLELILTQDAGHLSTLKSPRADQHTALPGIMDVGFAGGACLLLTNQVTCMYAGNQFDYTYVNPVNYGLDLWDVAKFDVATGGDDLDLTLKAAENLGSVSLPQVTYASFAPQAYGYVDVDGLDLGTLPELSVMMTMTAGDKTLNEVVTDLQTAGYTNSVVTDASTITMKIPADEITTDDGYFGWDFREFDGTVNATVSAVAFQFSPQGSIFIIQ
jgi:hypothetical protein